MQQLQQVIENAFDRITSITPDNVDVVTYSAVNQVISALDNGALRVAEKINGKWTTHQWLKKAILLLFRISNNEIIKSGKLRFFDKIPMKFANWNNDDFKKKDLG